MTDFILFSFFVTFCTCFLLTIFIISSDRRYGSFAMFNINLCVWSFCYGSHLLSESEEMALLYSKITLASLVLVPYLFFKTARFISHFEMNPVYHRLESALVIFMSLLMFTPVMVSGVSPFLGFNYAPDVTLLWYIFFIYLLFAVSFSFVLIYRSIKNYYKNRLIFYGFVIGWTGGFTTFFPYFGIELYQFATILIAIYSVIITYSMIIHRISDIFAISKGFIKIISFFILVASYVALSFIYNKLIVIDNIFLELFFSIIYFSISLELYPILTKSLESVGIDFGVGVNYKKKNIIDKINSEVLDVVSIDRLSDRIKFIIEKEMQIEIKSFFVSREINIMSSQSNLNFSKCFGEDIPANILKRLETEITDKKILLSVKFNEAHEKLKAIMNRGKFSGYIPFIFHDKQMGFITLKSRPNKKNYFYYEDMEVFDDLVVKVGIALERVRLHLQFMEEKELALISLAGSIAHELRNPLGAIKLTTDNLTSIKENSRYDENVKEVINKDSEFKETINNSDIKINNFKNQINKTIDLATNIIDMTLHEISGKRLTREDFDYYSAKKSVLDAIMLYGYDSNEEKDKVTINLSDDKNITAGKAGDQTISVNNIKEDNDFIILTNNTGFKYIIFNLVKNALYYLSKYPDSDIAISFEKEKIIDQKTIKKFNISNHNIKIEDLKLSTNFKGIYKYNVINIIDTGPGIKEEIITKIFQPYTSYKKNGTGVGLDFCNRMMGNFGGAIICESKLGKYTKFSLLFPILSEQEEKVAIGQILELEDKIAQAEKKGENLSYVEKSLEKKPKKNILLIDDVKVNIDILARDLKNKCPNFEVVIMTCPVEAFKLIKVKQEEDEQFDLILTDIEMPLMNGVDLINKVRNELKISKYDLPILVYGSREDKVTINEALDAGCNSYYMKPKDLRFIARNISKWVLNDYMPSKTINNKEIIINNQTLKDLNIIIADDQLMNLMLVSNKISNAGANIFKCNDGGDIIKLMTEDPDKYHLIITDINMKRIGGIEAAMKVRNIEAKHNKQHNSDNKIPIIALSGDNDQKFVMNLLNNSIDDYMIKGSDPKNIIKLSRFWVDYRFCNHDILSEDNKHNGNNILRSDFISLFSNKSSAIKVINVFKKESDSIIQEIRGNKTDVVELQKSIHKLKGSSDLIATRKLFEYLSEINIITKGGLPDNNNFDSIIEEYVNEAIDIMKLEIKRNFQI